MLGTWYTGIVTQIEVVNPSVKRFWIQVPEMEVFNFKPGQFVTLDLPIHEQKNKRWRSYSIASSPNNSNTIELIIVLLEGGAGTQYLFNQVNIGSELTLRGPLGHFTLPETLDKELFLICTGTGIAPFRSMINHVVTQGLTHLGIHLIFGCRTTADLLYYEELNALTSANPNITYIPALSRVDTVPNGAVKGYVHLAYQQLLEQKAKPPAHFFLCGWKNMIDEAKQNLLNIGYDKKDIHLELYG
jgi:ferredoxin-NADP reductase